MSKSRTRKRRAASSTQTVKAEATTTSTLSPRQTTVRAALQARNNGTPSLIMPAMVALGCWGLAISFAFFSSEQNHLLFGGMAALMAILWSVNLGLRVRKVQQRR
jgi:hypothetical protein